MSMTASLGLSMREAGGAASSSHGEDRGGERPFRGDRGAAEDRGVRAHPLRQCKLSDPDARAAEGVTDDDGDAFAGTPTKHSSEFFCGTVRMAWEQSYTIAAGNIGMVDAAWRRRNNHDGFRDEH